MAGPAAPGAREARKLPIWVSVLDALATALALVAVSVLLFGGFRVWILGARLSVTDWWRPALWALALAGVRHVRERSRPLPQRLRAGVRAWWASPDTRAVLPIHLATRLGVLVVGFCAVVMVGLPVEPPPLRIYDNALLDLPARWDAGWYLSIANEGYQWSPGHDRQHNIVFFPAFPMAVRYLSVVFGREPLWTGVGLSLVCFFWALVYLRRLARDQLGDDEQATAAVTFLATYPFALFFSAPYTESLFLLSMTAAVLHFRRNEIARAALWGLLTGLTRPNGAFLSVVLGLMVLAPAWEDWRQGRFRWALHADRLAAAAAPGMGMLLYSTYILFLTGHPFQWTMQQEAWGRTYRGLDAVVTDRIDFLTQNGLYAYAATQTLDLFYALSALFMLGAAWPVYRRFGLAYAALLLINLLVPMAAGGLLSLGRVTSVLFPAFLWLGAAVPAGHRAAWVALFGCLQGFAAVLFFTWRPLY